MTRLPALGARGEGWLVIQFGLLIAIVASAYAGRAWGGEAGIVPSGVGVVLMIGGGALAVRGIVDLRESLTPFPRPREGGRLIESGAYRLVRHPIYGGLVIGALGWGLFKASPLALALSVALLLFFDLKSRREEAWLADEYPGYADYRSRTRRLIPFLY
jgi:protein-S-isoprenylcysteine O-methyltransferase Ste14